MSTYAKIKLVIDGGFMEKNAKYLTEWEIRMKESIDAIVDDEINLIKQVYEEQEKEKIGGRNVFGKRPVRCDRAFYVETSPSKKAQEYETLYRRNYTLAILKRCGLDIEMYKKTWMGLCDRSDLVLRCIQDKIDGFDYDDNEERISNNESMSSSDMTVEFKDGVLTISDGTHTHTFMVDKDQLIYVDGVKVLNLSKESNSEKLMDLIENMKADRIAVERSDEKHLQYASTWRDEI